jgi:hypothetical protein
MELGHLKRDAKVVHSALKEVGDSLVAVKPLKIYVPEHYLSCELLNVSDKVSMVAIFGIVVGGYYSVSIADAMCITEPTSVTVVTIAGSKYYELTYEVGDKVMVNINLVQKNSILIVLYTDFLGRANVPWYFDYDELSAVFETCRLHAGASLQTDQAIIELLVSITARQQKDKRLFYRHDNKLYRPAYIGISNVAFQANDTYTKLAGGYFNDGLTSALVTPTTTNEELVTLIRQ